MSNDTETKVKITGDASSAEAAMAKATVAVASGVTTMRESLNALTGIFESLQSKMLLVAGVLAGGKAFKESVDKVVELNGEAIQLANALGVSAEEANVLNTALGNIFLDKDTYLTATKQLTKALNANEDAFKKMGVATRDAKGQLLPTQEILSQSVAALNDFKAGTDRNAMAQQIFGKNYSEVLKLAKLTPAVMQEAKDEVAQYHKELDPAAVQKYRQAMENAGDAFEGIKIAIGQVVMPVLTKLAQWFGEIGPTVVREFRVALLGLQAVFYAITIPIQAVIQFVIALVESLTSVIAAAVECTSAIAHGDWGRAKIAVSTAADGIASSFKTRFQNIKEYATDAAKSMADTWGKITDEPQKKADKVVGGGGKKDAFDMTPKKESTKTRTSDWSLELDNIKETYELQNNLRKYDIQKEVDYWSQRLSQATMGTQEYREVMKKLNDAKLKQAQDAQREAIALSQIEIERVKAQGEAQLSIDEDNARAQLDIGKINNDQYLELCQAFEERRFAIAKAALEKRLQLILSDPNSSPVERAKIHAELEALEAEHARKINEINIEKTKESMHLWSDLSNSMSSLWDKGLDAMMNGTLRWSNAYKAVLAELGRVFINFAADKAKAWLQTEVLQTAYTKVQTVMRSVLTKAGLIADTTATTTAASVKVGAEAAAAGAGAAASQAAIPIVGPGLALAAMGAMMVAVMGLKGSIKSARNGYDIPAGVNPMVQLHEQEMVLPKAQANAIRDMAAGGVTSGGHTFNFTINTPDTQGVRRLLMDNSNHVADAVLKQLRNGGLKL